MNDKLTSPIVPVRIVRLEPLRVICFNGFGPNPEELAWNKLKAWATARGIAGKRFFGYNNPNPDPGSPNYGYDVWMTVDEAVQADGEGRIIDFPGGLYAVLRCEAKDPGSDIPAAWQQLVAWEEQSPYRHGKHQWLEESFEMLANNAQEGFILDLYLPIVE